MKRLTLMIAGVLLFVTSASATDLLGKAYDEAYSVNWTGFYIGGQIGYGNANHDLTMSEYFKDYCEDAPEDLTGFESIDRDGSGSLGKHTRKQNVWKTVDNKIAAFPGITGTTCETLAKSEGKRQFDAGSHFTVPGDSRDIANIDGVNSHGVIGGGQIGYDQQVGSWVVGLFGNYNFSGMETDVSFDEFSAKIEKDDEWTAGIRAGRLLSERTMLYGLIGYTRTDYLFTASPDVDGLKDKVTFDGVTFGAGLEHAVTNNVFLGIEGTHTIYGDETILDSYDADRNTGSKVTDDLSETRVMGTLKIKLNGGF